MFFPWGKPADCQKPQLVQSPDMLTAGCSANEMAGTDHCTVLKGHMRGTAPLALCDKQMHCVGHVLQMVTRLLQFLPIYVSLTACMLANVFIHAHVTWHIRTVKHLFQLQRALVQVRQT